MLADPKPRPNHRRYLRSLQALGPEGRLRKAFELSELARALFAHGLRARFPERRPDELDGLLRSRLAKCHNRNY